MDHTIYWVDSKLGTINMMDHDGKKRHVVVSGSSIKKPLGLDVFESNMFWINRNDGSIMQQDKFGRGVPVALAKNLNNPKSVVVLHPYRYNNSLHNPCDDRHCSHLCVIVPGNRARCECPDGQRFVDREQSICDAASEAPLALPLVCKCRNGGFCREDTSCECEKDFSGTYCENEVRRVPTHGSSTPSAVVLPVLLILIVILAATGLYLYWRNKQTA